MASLATGSLERGHDMVTLPPQTNRISVSTKEGQDEHWEATDRVLQKSYHSLRADSVLGTN